MKLTDYLGSRLVSRKSKKLSSIDSIWVVVKIMVPFGVP